MKGKSREPGLSRVITVQSKSPPPSAVWPSNVNLAAKARVAAKLARLRNK